MTTKFPAVLSEIGLKLNLFFVLLLLLSQMNTLLVN